MPTGYTAKLMEKGQTRNEFILQCARGMGVCACVHMRDDDMFGWPLPPKKVVPSSYHFDELRKAEQKLNKLNAMTQAERTKFGDDERAEDIKSIEGGLASRNREEARLKAMVHEIHMWVPPTPDHRGLKSFMLQQLEVSSNGDDTWYVKRLEEAQNKTADAYFADALNSAASDIKYHAENIVEEQARADRANEWIDKLYKSLDD